MRLLSGLRSLSANYPAHSKTTTILGRCWEEVCTGIGERVGAYGEVYVCKSKTTRQVRAVKVLEKTAIEDSEKERFMSEINILKIMDHPNIVKLYEVFQDKKRYYLVTE